MTSIDGDRSTRRRQNSSSDSGRLPMWDSSDPDRAPPPLPLNPANPNLSPTRPNTSAHVAAAAQALADRARESSGMSPYTINAMHDRSPERSPTRNPQHKRLQSLQTGSLNSLKSSFENAKPTESEYSRPGTPSSVKDWLASSPSPSRAETPTALFSNDPFRDTPALSPSKRPPLRSILSENTPPSATKLAIQNMPYRDSDTPTPSVISMSVPPLANITNSAMRTPHNLETIHVQMQNLTSIATTLQKEMAALSRRSKDNATDLVGLKEATKTRDEDIRKSLRELVMSVRTPDGSVLGSAPRIELSQPDSVYGQYLDDKAFSMASFGRATAIPRGSAPSTYEESSENGRAASPLPYTGDTAASVAMLEKIIREMATKEGQERLSSTISELIERAMKDTSHGSEGLGEKMEELAQYIRDKSTSQALVMHNQRQSSIDDEPPHLDLDFDSPGPGFKAGVVSKRDSDGLKFPNSGVVSEDLLRLLQKIKDSISQSGGLTGEVKSLVRELRGEVLGMGRELGRKIENMDSVQEHRTTGDEDAKAEVSKVVLEGLSELKQQMDQTIQTRLEQSSSSMVARLDVDHTEIYAVVKQALAEYGLEQSKDSQTQVPPLDQEFILSAIRDAYENYKPEIELQQFGLERDEVLQCLKEGLEDYQSSKPSTQSECISKEDVLNAVHEAMQHFPPPAPANEAAEIKEEVLMTLRCCFEEFKTHNSSVPQPANDTDQIPRLMEEHFEKLRNDLKENDADSGKDVEQVLGSLNKSMEFLRTDIEAYIDQAKQASGNSEIIQLLRDGLENLRISVQSYVLETRPEGHVNIDAVDTIAYLKTEFERLNESINSQIKPNGLDSSAKHELLDALTEGFENLQDNIRSQNSDDSKDVLLGAIREEFEELRQVVLNEAVAQKEELLGAIQGTLSAVQTRVGDRDIGEGPNMTDFIKEEFDGLKATLAAPVLQYANAGDKDELLHTLKQYLDDIKTQLNANQNEAATESLSLIKEELAGFRASLGESLVPQLQPAAQPSGNVELLEAIRDGLDGLRHFGARNEDEAGNTELLEGIADDVEALRESMASGLARTDQTADTRDILEVVRTGHEDLKTHIEKQHEESRRLNPAADEILDAFHDGIGDLRADIAKFAEKPVEMDMTVSYDILDALKEGIAALRSDMEKLRSESESMKDHQVVLAATVEEKRNFHLAEEMLSGTVKKIDLEKLEVMLAHLQIKVEAMDQNMQSGIPIPSESGPVGAEALAGIDASLRDLQATISSMADRTSPNQVTRDDTDALETLLQNTKSRIDDVVIPILNDTITKEQFEAVENVVRLTKDTVEGLSLRVVEDLSTKDDTAAIGVLLENAVNSLRDLKEDLCGTDGSQKVGKVEIDAITESCGQILSKLEELPTTDIAPSKTDIEQLASLIQDVQKSQDDLRARYEGDIEVTANAFDDRKSEATALLDQMTRLKEFMDASKDDFNSRAEQSHQEVLQRLEDRFDAAPNAVPDIQEATKIITHEFERAHAMLLDLQSGHQSKSGEILEKCNNLQTSIVEDFAKQLEGHFTELTGRYNEQQIATEIISQNVEQAARSIADRSAQHDELLSKSEAMSEDLKLTIDTLGASVTTLAPALAEATERMNDDAKTVFSKVDDLQNKLNEYGVDAKTDHQLTREEVSKSLAAVDGVHQEVIGFQPRFMEVLSNILNLASEHFEHSKNNAQKSSVDFGTKMDEIKSSFAALPLPRLEAPPPVTVAPAPEKYDDTEMRTKLDELLTQATATSKSLPQMEKIDEIHQQVMTTAAEVAAFVSFQNKMATAVYDNKIHEANQAAIELNKYLTERDDLEIKVMNLREAKQSIASDIESLISERDSLTSQKMRLTAEVSSLTTALGIRREELQTMDVRADALERRIIDGVMNHSRALLLMKGSRGPPNMNLKRATSTTSHGTSSTMTPSSVVNTGIGMAVKSRPATRTNAATSHSGGRRILSLNQITNNVPAGGKAVSKTPQQAPSGLRNLKRTQSSRNPPLARNQLRKSTWGGHDTPAEFDKENKINEAESDLEDEDIPSPGTKPHDVQSSLDNRSASYTGTQISRSLRTTSCSTTNDPSEYSYGTGSYLTNTESNRRTSYGSTIRSRVGVDDSSYTGSVIEGDEVSDEEEQGDAPQHSGEEEQEPEDDEASFELGDSMRVVQELQQQQEAVDAKNGLVLRMLDEHDSGLGSDLPTAALSDLPGGHSHYFPSLVGTAEERELV